MPLGRTDIADPADGTLRACLRERTEATHRATERLLDLPLRLRSVAGYAELLATIDAYQRACEPLLLTVADELHAGWRARRERLAADLAALGTAPAAAVTAPAGLVAVPARAVAVPALPSPEHVLGAWYVFEGSVLGGVLIAAEVRRRLPVVASFTGYFGGDGDSPARGWRRFLELLDRGEPWDSGSTDRVVAGALDTFAGLGALLRAPERPNTTRAA